MTISFRPATLFFLLASSEIAQATEQMEFNNRCKVEATTVMSSGASRATAPKFSPDRPLKALATPLGSRPVENASTVLEVFVTERGDVSTARIAVSSGSSNLDRAALLSAGTWRLIPGTMNQRPVCMWGRFEVRFKP
jgi:TonB family protein